MRSIAPRGSSPEFAARSRAKLYVDDKVEQRRGAYEPTAPKHHWSDWYAAYVVARERGRTPDEAAREATLHIEAARDAA